LAGFLKSARLTAIADFFLPTLSSTSPREFVEFVGNVYQEAFAAHPHQHKTAGNAAGCLGCSIFSEQLYVNGGLYFLERGALDKAEQSLRTARWFAPWSPDAAANLGRTLQARAELMLTTANNVVAATRLLDEAINHYSDALGLRPGFRPYQLQLDEIYGLRKRLA
jgi:tetratricopeptide (TPR) repeat protein